MPTALKPIRIGQPFTRLVVVAQAETRNQCRYWLCQCLCGNTTTVSTAKLNNGHTRSCGCLEDDHRADFGQRRKSHGLSHRSEYRIWSLMKDRCSNPQSKSYPDYGGRGIQVCEEWQTSFETFYQHIGPRPSSEHSIDRIDNNKGYEPGNVQWATRTRQNQNSRKNTNLTLNGVTLCLAEWSRRLGIHQTTIIRRLQQGESDARALRPTRTSSARLSE